MFTFNLIQEQEKRCLLFVQLWLGLLRIQATNLAKLFMQAEHILNYQA